MVRRYAKRNRDESAFAYLKLARSDAIKIPQEMFQLVMKACVTRLNHSLAWKCFVSVTELGMKVEIDTWNLLLEVFTKYETDIELEKLRRITEAQQRRG